MPRSQWWRSLVPRMRTHPTYCRATYSGGGQPEGAAAEGLGQRPERDQGHGDERTVDVAVPAVGGGVEVGPVAPVLAGLGVDREDAAVPGQVAEAGPDAGRGDDDQPED